MLRSKLLQLNLSRCASFLSNNFTSAINQLQPINLPSEGTTKKQSLDVFIKQDNRYTDVLDKLLKLRKQKEATSVPLFPTIFVKQLMEMNTVPEIVYVLRNQLEYGIFLDKFLGCYLLDYLLVNKYFDEAAQVVVELVNQEQIDTDLVVALSLKSSYEYFRQYVSMPLQPPAEPEAPSEVTKVRVKYLRNSPPEDTSVNAKQKAFGRVLLKLCNSIDEPLKLNFQIVGHLLCEDYKTFEEIMSSNSKALYKDILLLCHSLVKNTNNEAHAELLEKMNQTLEKITERVSIDGELDLLIKKSVEKDESKIISEQNKNYAEWTKQYESALNKQLELQNQQSRINNIETILSDLNAQKQNLWFFEEKDSLDIKIFKKKVYYPKRWFGKKKVPKVVDNFYVPPEITRKD